MGCVHIYFGDGKGKTTAAIGQAIRAAGNNMNVVIVRFLKTEDSSELPVLRSIKGIHVIPIEKTFGFYYYLSEEEKKEAAVFYNGLFDNAITFVNNNSTDMIILDEILDAINLGIIDERDVLDFIERFKSGLEIILTGRNPSDILLNKAEYISKISKQKHPYDQGLNARKGIEY